ncbi:MAG: hypothetical protein ACYDDF_04970 [Thermoplasmatota archaeon]
MLNGKSILIVTLAMALAPLAGCMGSGNNNNGGTSGTTGTSGSNTGGSSTTGTSGSTTGTSGSKTNTSSTTGTTGTTGGTTTTVTCTPTNGSVGNAGSAIPPGTPTAVNKQFTAPAGCKTITVSFKYGGSPVDMQVGAGEYTACAFSLTGPAGEVGSKDTDCKTPMTATDPTGAGGMWTVKGNFTTPSPSAQLMIMWAAAA